MENDKAEKATHQEDAFELAAHATVHELTRLKLAEEIFELRFERKKRSSRLAVAMQSIVGFVAIAGFFANAVQAYLNKQSQQHQQQLDQERWSREFERAQRSDKYHAFFETSALATDENNPNKRLVGYALLKEFIRDPDYNDKATDLLTESLTQELRRDTAEHGLEESSRMAVARILDTLSYTPDCKALAKAARNVEQVSKRKAQSGDAEEASEVFGVFVRRVLGQAALACATFAEFQHVRTPFAQTLERDPALAGLTGPLDAGQINGLLVSSLQRSCRNEQLTGSSTECTEIFRHYGVFCAESHHGPGADERQACELALAPGHDGGR